MNQSPDNRLRKRLFIVTIPALILPLLASFFYFVLFPGTTFGNSFYTGIKIFLLAWPIIAVVAILEEKGRFRRQEGAKPWPSIVMGTLFGLASVGLMFGLTEWTPLGDVIRDSAGNIKERIEGLGVLGHFWIFAVFLSIIHAALEEFYWRWFVFGNLKRVVSLPLAYILAAVGFAAHHVVILSQFFPLGMAFFLGACVGIGGAVWCWLLQRHNTLWGAWVSHMIIDFGIMTMGWLLIKPLL